jgi:1-acyl-sn-glycerol-3-phosphate acyltransferase
LIEANNYSACIFPEGTRSRSGRLKPFMTAGINTLLRAAPSAVIVPFVLDGHSRMMKKGNFPLQFGEKITYTVLDPIEPKGRDIEELVRGIHDAIERVLNS